MNILLTCSGRRNYIVEYFKNSLTDLTRTGKVYAANSSQNSPALVIANRGFIVPPLNSLNYIDVLADICHQYKIGSIISLFDLELPVLALAKEYLASCGVNAVVSSPEVIEICNDKWKTYEFLTRLGLLTPKTFLDLQSALEAIDEGYLKYPLIVKPRWGMGSIGLMEAENQDELQVFYKRAQRIIKRSYLEEISKQSASQSILIQEKLAGKEYGLDVINDLSGQYVTTFVKEKIAMRSGETDVAMTVDSPKLRELGAILSSHLGHIANLDVDVFVDQEKAFILELNPRFGGGYPFSHLAGANLPAAIVAWLLNKNPDPSWFEINYGVVGSKGVVPITVSGDRTLDLR